jgi:hypothetical protein
MTQPTQSPAAPQPSSAATANPAVARCLSAWEPVHKAELARGHHRITAARVAAPFYRNAMPPLRGHENICDFVACAAHGILIGAIDGNSAGKLLYAAQVALATTRRQPAPKEPSAA